MKRMFLIIACAVLGYFFVSTTGYAAGKDGDGGNKLFQVVLDLTFEDQTYQAENEFGVTNSTAILNYITCGMSSASPSASNEAEFKLFLRAVGGGMLLVLNNDLELMPEYTPGPSGGELVGNEFVSACIGKKCDSLNGLSYESFVLTATRGTNIRTENMACILVGELFD